MIRSVILIFTVLLVSCSPANKYERRPEVKAWEEDIRKFEELDKSETYPGNTILFTGSSSIKLWSSLQRDMAPYPVIQRGFGGSKLSDFAVYADRIISPHKCSAIVIFIANDITGNEKDKSPSEVASLFRFLLKTIRKTHPDTPVFWVEITPTPSRWNVWPQIYEANSRINEICKKQENTYFISTSSSFIGSDRLPMEKYFVSDNLHLNEQGYELWTQIIKKEIHKVVPFPDINIIAHRGASYTAPENTVAAANLAWQLGSDAVECDIHLSADGKIMVNHDATTKRTSGKDFVIKNTAAAELRKLDVGSFKQDSFKGEKIPFLEELIATVSSGKELVVEIKCGPEVIPPLRELVDNSNKDIRFTFIAFDFNTISLTKKTFPENQCYWLCSDPDLLKQNISLVTDAGLNGVSLHYGLINEEVATEVRNLGLELLTWTVDDSEIARRMVELGVVAVTTNRPDYIMEHLSDLLQ